MGFLLRTRHAIKGLLKLIRLQRHVTRLLGPRNSVTHRCIELDVTYACTLGCWSCNRLCAQAPSDAEMTVEQVGRFIAESVEGSVAWRRIRVLGGEPTLHAHILPILEKLLDYRRLHAPDCVVELSTSGYGLQARNVLSQVPRGIVVHSTEKTSKVQLFEPVCVAPRDSWLHETFDYSNGCWITTESCGMGLTPYGYYPCAVAGTIDRVLGLDAGRRTLPADDDAMDDLLRTFCPHCGHFWSLELVEEEVLSPSWERALAEYERTRPKLTPY